MAVASREASAGQADQLRAYLDYFRDLGVYDFYRHPGDWEDGTSSTVAMADVEVADLDAIDLENGPAPEPASPLKSPPLTLPLAPLAVQPVAPPYAVAENTIPKPLSFDDRWPQATVQLPAAERMDALRVLQEEIGDCTRCPLAYGGRRSIVFGDGSPHARLMFVGEGPGADEDASGVPFVGKAGQLLNNMIGAMGLTRDQVYIANIVKCRPPNNRVPEPVEAGTCTQFLVRQIDIVRPEVIVALGGTAAMYLLGVKQTLASLRGQWFSTRGAKVAVTYHPAFLLRDPRQKSEAWKDLQRVMAELGLKTPVRS